MKQRTRAQNRSIKTGLDSNCGSSSSLRVESLPEGAELCFLPEWSYSDIQRMNPETAGELFHQVRFVFTWSVGSFLWIIIYILNNNIRV